VNSMPPYPSFARRLLSTLFFINNGLNSKAHYTTAPQASLY